MATAFLAMNEVYGALFDVGRAEAATLDVATARASGLRLHHPINSKEMLMRSPQFVINGTIQVLASDIPEFIRSSNVCAAETLKEPGCVYYYMGQGLTDPKQFHLSEGWADEAAHEAHLLTPHFKLAMREVAAITLEAVTMKRYSVTGEKDLSDIALPKR